MEDWTNIAWEKLLSTARKNTNNTPKSLQSPFSYDYNKAVFSSSFRRLQHKTQVFPLERLDYVRSRLTHSIEVATIAENLVNYIFKNVKLKDRHKNSFPVANYFKDIESTVSLIHDIGNPPFGHYGEEAIRTWFENNQKSIDPNICNISDYLLFDGNAQGFRVITKLQIESHDKPSYGLNLTAATVAAICKTTETAKHANSKKICCLNSEIDFLNWAFESCGLVVNNTLFRHPISYIMEAADDIANCASDLEDAIKKNVLTFENLKKKIADKFKYNHYMYKTLNDSYNEGVKNGHPDPISLSLKELRFSIQNNLIISLGNVFLSQFKNMVGGIFIKDLISLADKDSQVVYSFLKNDIAFEYIYCNKDILKKEISGGKVIHGLMDEFFSSMIANDQSIRSLNGKLYNIISDNFKYIMPNNSNLYDRIQLMVDYISGMTDTYAHDLYQEIYSII